MGSEILRGQGAGGIESGLSGHKDPFSNLSQIIKFIQKQRPLLLLLLFSMNRAFSLHEQIKM